MGFSRQEYWSGVPFPFPGELPNPGIEPRSPALKADALTSEPPGKLTKSLSKYFMRYAVNTKVKKTKWDPVLFERETETEAERQRAEKDRKMRDTNRHKEGQRQTDMEPEKHKDSEGKGHRGKEVRKIEDSERNN